MQKRRILFTGEASFLSTGFAKFNRHIIEGLHATGKYEIAEMGSYASSMDERAQKLPWKFYGVSPDNQQEKQLFDSLNDQQKSFYHFGKHKIDGVLADFQPDIVFDVRDPWMLQHLVDARFRANYKLVVVPTVDSAPQRTEWVNGIFKKADVCGTYSRYGRRVLSDDGVDVKAVIPPGVDLDVFKPLDPSVRLDNFGLNRSLLVFGTVMRNQKRKLFPELFDAYSRLRKKHTNPKLIKKLKVKVDAGKKLSKSEQQAMRIHHSALLCHTSWPDNGWNIPDYLRRFNLRRHVIFTYKCDSCNAVFVSWFIPSDARGLCLCQRCGKHTAHMPNTHSGISEEKLVEIYNLMDVYIQTAICEGWGLPITESKACGVPGLYQNYSAMEDHVENGGGLPIKIGRYFHEAETAAIRTLPDVDDLVRKMEKLAFNEKLRDRMGKEARKVSLEIHNWQGTVDKVDKLLSSMEILDRAETWDRRPKFEFVIPQRPPNGLSDENFVLWCYINILHRTPDEKGFQDWMGNLKQGASRDSIEGYFRNLVIQSNTFEEVRWDKSLKIRGLPPEIKSKVEEEDVVPGALI